MLRATLLVKTLDFFDRCHPGPSRFGHLLYETSDVSMPGRKDRAQLALNLSIHLSIEVNV
jgi:hypothetical protein